MCHFSKEHASIGVAQTDGIRRLEYRENDSISPGEAITMTHIWLRSVWGFDRKSRFSYSLDRETFSHFSEMYQLKWGNYRGDRIGIYAFNDKEESGFIDVDFLEYEVSR